MKYSEKWGDSIDAAVNLALQDLQLTREQVKVTVLEEPSRGFLGIGAKLAKVRVEEIVPEKEVKMIFTGKGTTAKTEKSEEVKAEAPSKAPKPKKKKKENKINFREQVWGSHNYLSFKYLPTTFRALRFFPQ